MAPLILFWGLMVIPEFMYRFKHSVPYYEILALDVARVEYDHKKDSKSGGKKNIVPDAESIRLNEESLRIAREKRAFKKMKLDDLK